MSTASLRMGDVLVTQGAISRQALEEILRRITRTPGRIGEFLRAQGLIDGMALARAIATQQKLQLINFSESPPEMQLYCPRDVPHYLNYFFIPYLHRGGTLTIASPDPSTDLLEFAQTYYRMPVTLVVISRRDFYNYFTTRGAAYTTRQARLGLRRRYPHLVADRILMRHQSQALFALMTILAAALLASPFNAWLTLVVACNVFYFTTLLVKLKFYQQGLRARQTLPATYAALTEEMDALREDELPIYSVLVPLFRESEEVLEKLIRQLDALDYPKEKLDIKLICEADDKPTLDALKTLKPPQCMQIIAVPPSSPRTKPKACNVALSQVRGEYVVIYDAEDAPAHDQLKRAVALFRLSPPNTACLQASLNYFNRNENILTRLFSIEYSALFNILLPGLERLGLPIPLGGTSNHLNTAALRDVGGWDAFNVTEDADLGIRLHYFGYATRTLPSLTLEECPIGLNAWLKQRTRWIKGYIQTWLVFTRDPAELKKRLGRKGYYGFQFFIGAPALTFLLAPFFWVAFILSLTGTFNAGLSITLQWLCAASFIGGTLTHWLFARQVIRQERWQGMQLAALLYPLYWILHSFAAARALLQLITAPHYWDKTRHGVSKWAHSS